MLNGIHGHQDIERVVYGRPAGPALRAEAERLGAKRVFVTTTKSVSQSALLADVIKELGDRYAGVYAGITAHSPRPCVIEGAQMARNLASQRPKSRFWGRIPGLTPRKTGFWAGAGRDCPARSALHIRSGRFRAAATPERRGGRNRHRSRARRWPR